MNIDPTPEMPERKVPSAKPNRSFEDILKEIQPQLNAMPHDQQIPVLPPDKMTLASVEEFVRESGMSVSESCPSRIALAGEFLDRCQLREGRVGLHGNFRVVSFLIQYSDKTLRSVVIYPRDGIDARLLGMAILWGLVADVPETVAQSKVLAVRDFFQINAFDLNKLIDMTALEQYESDCRVQIENQSRESLRSAQDRIAGLEAALRGYEGRARAAEQDKIALGADAVRDHNRAETWRLIAAVTLVACAVLTLVLIRHG
jgi:hypothetical protein